MSKTAANKKRLKHHLSTNEQHDDHSWPNLPQQLISLLPRQKKLMLNITSFGCVTKTWRSTPKQCSKSKWPQLVEINTKPQCSNTNHKNMCTHVRDIQFHEVRPYPYHHRVYSYWKSGKKIHTTKGCFKGYSNGCLLYVSLNNHWYKDRIQWENYRASSRFVYSSGDCLPPWDLNNHPIKSAAVIHQIPSVGNDHPYCTMVLTGQSSHTLASSHMLFKPEWYFRDYVVKDPYNPGRDMEFSQVIGFNGKFYLMSLQGSLVVLEEDTSIGGTSDFEITGVSKTRAVPCNMSKHYREFFVELNGELLLVFLISRKSLNVVDDVEVLRLNDSELSWVKVDSLGEGTLFLEDECCMGVNAEKIGCTKNCIYFTHSRVDDDMWFVYDMKIGQIFPATGGPIDYLKWDEPIDLEDPIKRYHGDPLKW